MGVWVCRLNWDRLRTIHLSMSWVTISARHLLLSGSLHHLIRRSPFQLPESVLLATASRYASNNSPTVTSGLGSISACSAESGKDGRSRSTASSWTRKNPGKSLICRGSSELGMVPRRGLEPPRCYSLVPETSASTNSAIWAHLLQGMTPCNAF